MPWCWWGSGSAPALLSAGMGRVEVPGQEMEMVGGLPAPVLVSSIYVPIEMWGWEGGDAGPSPLP